MTRSRDRRRLLLGVILAVVLIPATIAAGVLVPRVTLTSTLLVLLLEVVVVAGLSHVAVAVATAVAAVLLANWFLVQPQHTFAISNVDDVVALVVFVLAAISASLVVRYAIRAQEAATRSATEAAILRRSVSTPAEQSDPVAVLEHARSRFGLTQLQLVAPSGALIAETPGQARLEMDEGAQNDEPVQEHRTLSAALPEGYVLRGDGPSTLGLDQQLLASLGAAALRSWQARELAAEAARAEEIAAMDRARSALLAGVGHDLRTPIAAISVAAAALGSDVPLPERDHEELVATISESARRLDELVANLLDMSRLEAGRLIAHLQPVDTEEMLAEAALAAGTSRIEVEAEPGQVLADSGLLERVLANLLSNALRHSPADRSVVLAAERRGDVVRLAVIDRGTGLPEALAGVDPFRPFQGGGDRSVGGLGLGLAIARGFVEAMQGEIRAEPTPGGGLTMVVELAAA